MRVPSCQKLAVVDIKGHAKKGVSGMKHFYPAQESRQLIGKASNMTERFVVCVLSCPCQNLAVKPHSYTVACEFCWAYHFHETEQAYISSRNLKNPLHADDKACNTPQIQTLK